jgi:hypothetical protein
MIQLSPSYVNSGKVNGTDGSDVPVVVERTVLGFGAVNWYAVPAAFSFIWQPARSDPFGPAGVMPLAFSVQIGGVGGVGMLILL